MLLSKFPRGLAAVFLALSVASAAGAQQSVNETRDPRQKQDPEFAKAYAQWTGEPRFGIFRM